MSAFTIRKIEAILQESCDRLMAMGAEHERDIERALTECEDGESVTLNHSIKLDIGKNKQTDRLSLSIRTACDVEGMIPDPNQMPLPMGGE